MSLINTEIKPFDATAFHNGAFVRCPRRRPQGQVVGRLLLPGRLHLRLPDRAGDLADHYAEFQKLGVEVYSVSTDTHFTHKAWHDTSDTIGKIEYPMVGDPTRRITRTSTSCARARAWPTAAPS